ncbi:MAG: di-trans,poly-cis-decaprenylcistransferase [Chloroflexi bacterium 44-23]|nr:MAG: di-trans,poly-cis-decaprenylcistransferase [Chloroflexi bacterium 44-23]
MPSKTDLPLPQLDNVPRHIAIIMDGNGRWAKKRGLTRLAGHRSGTENLRRIIRACVEFGVQYLTIYAFSTENWGRPADEVEGLMHILEEVIDKELNDLHEEGVQLRHIGRLEQLNPTLRSKVEHSVEITKENHRLILCIAWNYGGRDEIVCAIRNMMKDGVKPEDVTDELVSSYLFTAGIPDPDLIIRTSGEMRISNFLIWQASYSEWYVTPTLWPDFDREELYTALSSFSQRERRFGKLSDSENELIQNAD